MIPPSLTSRFSFRSACAGILAVSFLLRAILAWRGGQMFWPDEDRFDLARRAARRLFSGEVTAALEGLFAQPDHLLFKLASLLPASLEVAAGAPAWTSALFFAAISTGVLGLVAVAARAAGGNDRECLLALTLAACASSLFYYSRHLLPYDLSLGWLLLSLIAGLRQPGGPGRSFLAGLLAGLGFLTYNGYWTLAGAVLVVHVCRALPHPAATVMRGLCAAAGLVTPVLAAILASATFGHDFIARSVEFSGTVAQGDLGQAGRFVPEYLWIAEGPISLLWLVGLAACLVLGCLPGNRPRLLWPLLALLVAAFLIVPSDLLGHFALSARHVRVLTPFLCLAVASALAAWSTRHPHSRLPAVVVLLAVAQAAWNFATPLGQVFPPQFEAQAIRLLAEARTRDLGPYKLVNGSFLHSPEWAPAGPDPGVLLLRRDHPFQFAPYLYEGYSAELRRRYQARDLSMRVIRLDVGGPARAGYPAGLIELTLQFPEKPFGLLPEPLLSTGRGAAWDSLFAQFPDASHIQFGLDHPGAGAILSPVLPLDRTKPHRLLVNLGSLYPPGSPGRAAPTFVFWDDALVLRQAAGQSADSRPEDITFGHNFVGSSASVPQLSAAITRFRRVIPHDPDSVFSSHPGTLELELLPFENPTPFFEPLLSAGPPGHGDAVFLRSEGGGRLRFGFDHWGGGSALSETVQTDPNRMVRLEIAQGSFFPPEAAPVDGIPLRKLYLRCNDRVVFNRFVPFHSSSPEWLAVGRNLAASTLVEPRTRFPVLNCVASPATDLFPETRGYPGAVRVTLNFLQPPEPGQSEPLLSTGRSGAGDLLFIRFATDGSYRIGLDHWGHGLVLSEPRQFNPTRPLELTLSLGSLYPPDDPAFARLHRRLLVMAGTQVILDQPAQFHPALPASRVLGFNAIGASTARRSLSADVLDYTPVPPETILSLLATP